MNDAIYFDADIHDARALAHHPAQRRERERRGRDQRDAEKADWVELV